MAARRVQIAMDASKMIPADGFKVPARWISGSYIIILFL